MNYKEKYEMALEGIQEILSSGEDSIKMSRLQLRLQGIFPELKESEDERMVKFIKNQLFNIKKTITENYELDVKLTKAIDWLEKQGVKTQGKTAIEAVNEEKIDNQNCVKPSDKVEPKFHEGDWIVNNTTLNLCHIVKVEHGQYVCSDCSFPITKENEYHIWSIEDAKDGDVLACNNGWTCIFKTLINDETFSSYCFMDNTKWFCETGSECHTLKEEFVEAYNGKIYPATKEQRDTLMKAMEHAGYTFDFEKKELKLLITNGGDFESENCEQKFDWSEVDDYNVQCLVAKAVSDIQKGNIGRNQELIDWLKSLKQRMEE